MSDSPCDTCPFARRMSAAEMGEACEGGPGDCEMLCHGSGSLDGEGADVACRGFAANLARAAEGG